MRIVYQNVAGLDVHKKIIVASIIVRLAEGSWHEEKRNFGSMTTDLLALSDWLLTQGVTHVAMESTGEYWGVLETSLQYSGEQL
jgi:hypothetical protein